MGNQRGSIGFLRGQSVEVLGLREIAATLDPEGSLEGLPFMPEMARFCGQRLRVYRRAGKTCVEGHGLRRLERTVLLEGARCDGAFHDGCQRTCLYFWKEAWLRPAPPEGSPSSASEAEVDADAAGLAFLARLEAVHEGRYVCQSTRLLAATTPLSRWNVTHFLGEMAHGELTAGVFLKILALTLLNRVRALFGLREAWALAGVAGRPPKGDLDLKPGEWVEIKPPAQLKEALDPQGRNRGLSFEPDMAVYAGRRCRVAFPVQRIIHEQTGRMVHLTHTVALEGVTCGGLCSKNCPRNNTLYWRESWLTRAEPGPNDS